MCFVFKHKLLLLINLAYHIKKFSLLFRKLNIVQSKKFINIFQVTVHILKLLRAFVRIADEVTPQIINEYGDIYYRKEDVNTIVSKYLGISDYSWDENFIGLGGDRLWKVWDMKTVYAVITEQTDSYIDMVYFADYVYLTPAKKMRYFFTNINDSIQLNHF